MRKVIDLVVLLIVVVAGVFAVINAQNIGDWAHSLRYDPPTEIVQIADGADMSETGRKLFYRFEPQLLSGNDLKSQCGDHALGCAEGRYIYILDYPNTGSREYYQSIVTAGHEMLHIAYSRLSDAQKQDIHSMLDDQLKSPNLQDVDKKLKSYPASDYYNEAHSFVGTEVLNLNSDLEQYYQTYFNDRKPIIDAFKSSPII